MKIILISTFQEGALAHSIHKKLIKLGHEVRKFDQRRILHSAGYEGMVKELKEYSQIDMDLALVIKGDSINPEDLHIPKILWFPDDVNRYPWINSVYKGYDISYGMTPNLLEGLRYLPVGVDTDVHYHIPNAAKRYKISFAGTCRPERTEFMRKLWDKYQIVVYGNSWNPNAPYYRGSATYGFELNVLYSSSEFVFNHVLGGGINSRVLETMAIGGGVLLTNEDDNVAEFFEDGEHLFFYDDIEEIYDIVDNTPKEELEKISRAARGEITKNHTLEVRLKKILEDFECLK